MPLDSVNFVGLDTRYQTADGQRLTRLHLDGAASPLAAQVAVDAILSLLPHYSNTHSHVHNSAQISSQALDWAHQEVLDYLGADPSIYTTIFMGAGTTAAINRLARGLHSARPERNVVLVSAMEHHANDLPHRQFGNEVHYVPLQNHGDRQGAIDLPRLAELLDQYRGKINYLALSAVSNVTGIINPVEEVTELAHRHDVLVLLDAAQSVAHQAIQISASEHQVDFLIFSGHKVYCPTAPGVLVANKAILQTLKGHDLGGGSVADVSYYDFQLLTEYPQKEQAGTPNIVGAVALASVLQKLAAIGQQRIEQHSRAMIDELFTALCSLPHIKVYGDHTAPRIGALSFNHELIDHGLLAAILNDYYAIAVRNECFCAHPYVSSLIKEELWELDLSGIERAEQQAFINRKRGMVRASMSLYNSSADIERLIAALVDIDKNIEEYRDCYRPLEDGNYQHHSFRLDWRAELGWRE